MKNLRFKYIIFNVLLIFSCTLTLSAQPSDIYKKIEEILALQLPVQAASDFIDAEKMGNLSYLYPENPRIEVEYLRPNPRLKNQAFNYQISQEFEFPSVYSNRKHLAKAQNESLEIQLNAYKRDYLEKTLNAWSEWVFASKKVEFLKKQSNFAKKIQESTEKLFDAGQISILERNKAQVFSLNIEKNYQQALHEKLLNQNRLLQFNNGEVFEFLEEKYPVPYLDILYLSELENVENTNLALLQADKDIEANTLELKLKRSENLPEFEIGYIREQDIEVDFKGVSLGISIPIWKNKNATKTAKLKLKASQKEKENIQNQINQEIRQLFLLQELSQKYFQELDVEIKKADNQLLLEKAFQLGEITIIDFVTEQNMYSDLYEKYLETELNLSKTWILLYTNFYMN